MIEIWKNVKGWEEYYQVSTFGRVRSLDRIVNNWPKGKRSIKGRILKNMNGNPGYYTVELMASGRKRKRMLVHRIVAITFIKNPDNKPYINHLDGNGCNNIWTNIEWCTQKENIRHAIDIGLFKPKKNEKGENSISAKLTNAQVVSIKKRLINGETPKNISKDYPVGDSAISEIKAGRSWGILNSMGIKQ